MRRSRLALIFAALLVIGIGGGVGLAAGLGGSPHQAGRDAADVPKPISSPAKDGWPFHRLVPATSLETAHGKRLSLRALKGKVVVLAPSMTLCQEVCPLTTQAFITMRHEIAADGLGNRVAFVEATVDPWRDSPARLRAYDKMTGADFIQLTGSLHKIRRFWNWFGIGFRKVQQSNPPDIDWWTHKPEKFDVEHTDGLFLIDSHGYERSFFPGMADVHGHIEPALRRLLSKTGINDLEHPSEAWTEAQVLAGVGRLLGVHLGSGGSA